MIRMLALSGAISFALAAGASAQGMAMAPPDAAGPMMGSQFITAASQSDEFERTEGKMAETMGASPAVRHFGAKMVSAHTRTTVDLHAAIRQAGMAVPPPPPMRPDQMQMISELSAMSGRQFDRAYLDQQLQAHEQTLELMNAYASTGEVPSLKAAAQMTVPIVQSHIDMVKQIESSMG